MFSSIVTSLLIILMASTMTRALSREKRESTSSNVLIDSIPVVNVASCTLDVLNGIKYVAHSNDSSRYVECVGVGVGMERACVNGSVFDPSKVGCVMDEASLAANSSSVFGVSSDQFSDVNNVSNSSVVGVVDSVRDNLTNATTADRLVFPRLIKKLNIVKKVGQENETSSSEWCLNGGVEHVGGSSNSSSFSCICLMGFTGVKCETSVVSAFSIVSHIYNQTFVWDEWWSLQQQQQQQQPNKSNSVYDAMMTRFVDSLWSELSAELAYMQHSFNWSSLLNDTTQLGRRLHRLAFYSRHDLTGFKLNFKTFVKSLDNLTDSLLNSSMKSDAIEFTTSWTRAHNLTRTPVSQNVTLARAFDANLCRSIASRIQETLNRTHVFVDEFYRAYLNRSVIKRDVEKFVADVSELVDKSWRAVVKFGFWRVTKRLSGEESFGESVLFDNDNTSDAGVSKRSVASSRDERLSSIFKTFRSDMDVSTSGEFMDLKSIDRKQAKKIFRQIFIESTDRD